MVYSSIHECTEVYWLYMGVQQCTGCTAVHMGVQQCTGCTGCTAVYGVYISVV